jgi:hypothetical protein
MRLLEYRLLLRSSNCMRIFEGVANNGVRRAGYPHLIFCSCGRAMIGFLDECEDALASASSITKRLRSLHGFCNTNARSSSFRRP